MRLTGYTAKDRLDVSTAQFLPSILATSDHCKEINLTEFDSNILWMRLTPQNGVCYVQNTYQIIVCKGKVIYAAEQYRGRDSAGAPGTRADRPGGVRARCRDGRLNDRCSGGGRSAADLDDPERAGC